MGRLKRIFRKREKERAKAERSALGFKKQVWDWNFKVWTPVEYELEIIFNAENKMFLTIFQQAKKRLEKKSVQPGGDPELVDKFDLDERFFNLVKTYLKKPFNLTAADVLKEHGFFLVDYYVVSGWFERDAARNWNIHVVLKGTYTDKR